MATIIGTFGDDTLTGTESGDTIEGRAGNDIINGLGGNDTLLGGGGGDTITGGLGNDTLSGGTGVDGFVFNAGDGQDIVTDLAAGEIVQISGYGAAQSITQSGSNVVVILQPGDQITFQNTTVATVEAAMIFGDGGGGGGGDGGPINGDFVDAVFSADGTKLFAVTGNQVKVFSVSNGALLTTYTIGTDLGAIDVSQNGAYLAIVELQPTSGTGTLYRLNLTTGSVTTHSIADAAALYDVAFLPDGNVIFSQQVAAPLQVLNLTTGNTFQASIEVPANSVLTTSADGSYVLAKAHNFYWPVYTYDSTDGSGYAIYGNPDPFSGAALPPPDEGVGAVSPDGDLVVDGMTLQVFNRDLTLNVSLGQAFGYLSQPSGMAFSPDGSNLYIAGGDGHIFVFSTASWDVVAVYQTGAYAADPNDTLNGTRTGFGNILTTSPDGRYLSVITEDGLQIVDLETAISVAGPGDDILSGSGAQYGFGGNDQLTGDGWSFLYGGTGDDTYYLGGWYDRVNELANQGNDTVHSSLPFALGSYVENLVLGGTDDLWGSGNALANTLTGNEGANELSGLQGDDILSGAGGDDMLSGGAGSDQLDGGAGVDTATYQSELYAVSVSLAAAGAQDTGGSGFDTLSNIENLVGSEYDDSLTGNIGANTIYGESGSDVLRGGGGDDDLYGGTEDDILEGGDGADELRGDDGDDDLFGNAGDDFLDGGTGDDILSGEDGSDTLSGMQGHDVLVGGIGDDSLGGGLGNDSLDGGAGDDTAIFGGSGAAVNVSLAISGPQETGEGIDTLTGIENLSGSPFDDTLNGDSGANTLAGAGGSDTINGGGGDDWLTGGSGLDLYLFEAGHGNDNVLDLAAGETLRIYGYAMAQSVTQVGTKVVVVLSSVDQITVWDSDVATVQAALEFIPPEPTEGDDNLTGTAGDDLINALGGNDTIDGLAGNDTIIGGLGDDTMTGGIGNDIYRVDSAGDTTVELSGEGADTVRTTISWTLAANIETLELIGAAVIDGTGNELANRITGNSAANVLSGMDGIDQLYGRAGNDSLSGGVGNDSLYGGDGGDSLDGGTGDDLMAGGLGDDLYQVDSISDATQEGSGQGTDTVQSSVTWSLRNNFENLELTGASAINGTGNALANTITGNEAVNVLSGGSGGADQLFGEGGDDTLKGGTGNDILDGGSGRDLFYGGLDADTFVFSDGDFAGLTTTTADKIVDFSLAEGDTLDLSGVDGDSMTGGLQDLVFIGTAAFSNTAGELRYEIVNGNTYVTGDTDGDGVADFMFWMTGSHALTSGDIVI